MDVCRKTAIKWRARGLLQGRRCHEIGCALIGQEYCCLGRSCNLVGIAKLDIDQHCRHSSSSPLQITSLSPPIKMLRTVAVRALRASSTRQVTRRLMNARSQSITSSFRSSRIAPTFAVSSIRCYSAPSGLAKEEVQGRIMDLLKNFDKVRNLGVCP